MKEENSQAAIILKKILTPPKSPVVFLCQRSSRGMAT